MPRRFEDNSDEAVMARLVARCVCDPNSGCWLWTGATDAKGYGTTWDPRAKRVSRAHRLSYELHNGPLLDGQQALHRCDTPPCIRPDHLFPGTNADNVADREAKGRGNQPSLERHGRAKLTTPGVLIIRSRLAAGETLVSLAADFGVSFATISRVKRGVGWNV